VASERSYAPSCIPTSENSSSETVWKIAEGLLSALLWCQESADRDSFGSSWPLSEPRFGTHSDFPNSFSRLDFSHSGGKGVGYARHTTRPKEVIKLRTLPTVMIRGLTPFAPLFSERVWQHAQVLLVGAILAPGRRTVSSALRAMGLDQEKRFHRYHRVLSCAS
jgi:hypothetical protein